MICTFRKTDLSIPSSFPKKKDKIIRYPLPYSPWLSEIYLFEQQHYTKSR